MLLRVVCHPPSWIRLFLSHRPWEVFEYGCMPLEVGSSQVKHEVYYVALVAQKQLVLLMVLTHLVVVLFF